MTSSSTPTTTNLQSVQSRSNKRKRVDAVYARLVFGVKPSRSLWAYESEVVPVEEQQEMFEVLKGLVDPQPKKVLVFGWWVPEARLNRFYSKAEGVVEYGYSGMRNKAPLREWPDPLERLRVLAEARSPHGTRYNVALINLYRDGRDHVGAHEDKDAVGTTVASFSFGAAREFAIHDHESQRMVDKVTLEPGSLLLMFPGFQSAYKHSLPKRLRVREPRVNATFRYHHTKE